MTVAVENVPAPAPGEALNAASLEGALRAVEPNLVLVPRWVMQSVIAADRGMTASAFTVPHRKSHWIARSRLVELAGEEEIALPESLPGGPTVLLLRRPSDRLSRQPRADVLRHYWRLLFHARVDALMQSRIAAWSAAELQERIERTGRSPFNEARVVLARERYLATLDDERAAYREWVAVYLELSRFRPELVRTYFPALGQAGACPDVLAQEIDAEALLRQTRPQEAGDAAEAPLTDEADEAAHEHAIAALHDLPRGRVVRDGRRAPRLLARAQRAQDVGNTVRAAILRTRVFRAAPHDKAPHVAAMRDLDTLVERLRQALHLGEGEAHEWRAALEGVLARAAVGWWNREGRLLYDLQKVCVDHEREIYSVGVVEWLLEFGRRPLRRPQPNQRRVLMLRSLRSALRRAPRARLAVAQRERLTHLLHQALDRTEARLREALRPAIVTGLAGGGVRPRNAVERVAEGKLVEELLDGLADKGFLTMGGVRDAISRNQIKLHDIKGFAAFFRGDQLLRIDRRLSRTLDGVYHRGEAYLRFFQKSSSALFATAWGRALTQYVLLPAGGAYVILEGLDHTLVALFNWLTKSHWLKLGRLEEFKGPVALGPRGPRIEIPFNQALLDNIHFFLLTFFLVGLINWPAFRHTVMRGLRAIGHGLHRGFVEGPRWLASRPWVQAIWKSRAMRLGLRFVVKPLAFAEAAWLLTPRGVSPRTHWIVLGSMFLAANLVLNNRTGRALEQAVLQWLRNLFARVTTEILANILRGILHFFQRAMEYFDRAMYAVDEWLRFRSGQSRFSLIAKASLGVVWFFIAYITRFAVNLLIEPQINPVKHFPVVTVSHKIVLPSVGLFESAYLQLGLSAMRARTLAATTVTSIPGIFGFLAWELRSNWMLYAANRHRTLRPVQIGSHGETLPRLLRPGFHSGTVPKIFARLRRAQRHIEVHRRFRGRAEASVHKQHEAAEHVREAVRHFVQRELVALLNEQAAWRDTPLAAGDVELSVTRLIVALSCPGIDPRPAKICFEERSGWILAHVDAPGWTERLDQAKTQQLCAALLGLYKIAGADVVQEQIETAFIPPQAVAVELSPDELMVWPGRSFRQQPPLVFDLHEKAPARQPQIGRQPLMLRGLDVEWGRWVQAWEPDGDGHAAHPTPTTAPLPPLCLLGIRTP
jgi:hypothetical protein